jgi:hypothetical protein
MAQHGSPGGGSGLVAWPVFKTATEAPRVSPVGSIPTRSRHPRRRARAGVLALVIALPTGGAEAQDTLQVRPDLVVIERPATAPPDTVVFRRPPVGPAGAFLRSALVPGWAQAVLDRRLTAGLFMGWEAVTAGMTIKAHREARYLKRIGSPLLADKRREREDWLVLLAFNHLFAALEAFVGSHLWDFPEDVRLRAIPAGDGLGVGLTIPLGRP